jgi:serine/threonine protein kinase
MKRTYKKKSNKIKTRKIKGGTVIHFDILSKDGFNGTIITPNIPFIDDTLITKLGTKEEITNEYNAYQIIKQINSNQDTYNEMKIKVLCNPQPIMFMLNNKLLNAINLNGELNIKSEHTHGIIMKRGQDTMKYVFNNNNNGILNEFIQKIYEFIGSLTILNNFGYIHGDIKGNNILIFENNLYLIDFGTFMDKSKYEKNINEKNNKLCDYLEHTPYETQYLNENIEIKIIENTFVKTKKLYLGLLEKYKTTKNITNEILEQNLNKDINNTLEFIKLNRTNYLDKLFETYDVFCLGCMLIQLLNMYFINEKIILLYDLLIEEVYTYDITKRINMNTLLQKYINIFK